MNRQGKLYVISAPSGAGKTSLVKGLLESLNCLKLSVSYTTRPARKGEEQDRDYHFVSEATFHNMVASDAFLEHAVVYGHHYGTGKAWVKKQLDQGIDIILEIDWQGAAQIRHLFSQALSVFILPPSLAELNARLLNRNQDDPKIIARRMAKSDEELAHYHEFDYLVVNDQYDHALRDLQHIIYAERLKCASQKQLQARLLVDLLQKQ